MPNFRQLYSSIMPTWLSRRYGERFVGAIAYHADIFGEAFSQAIRTPWVRYGPPDALAPMGEDAGIERAPKETDDQYRERLITKWILWEESATELFAANALAPFGVPAASCNVVADFEWSADPASTFWSRWWLILDGLNYELPWQLLEWGGPTWSQWGQGNTCGIYTWGTTATQGEIQAVIRFLCKWKSAHEVGVCVLLDYGGHIWGAPPPWGAPKTWGGEVVCWPLGSFWGDKYAIISWGSPFPYNGATPANWGIKFKI